MEVVLDNYSGEPLRLIVGSEVEHIDHQAKWAQRRKQLNRLLSSSKGTHLLQVSQDGFDTYLAGRKGLSLRVALERASKTNETILDTVVVIPLDESVYWARMEQGFLMEEHCATEIHENKLAQWENEKQKVIFLAGGMQTRNLPSGLEEVELELDMEGCEFLGARSLLMSQRMFRTKDVSLLCFIVLVCVAAFFWRPIYATTTGIWDDLFGGQPVVVEQTIEIPDFHPDATSRLQAIASYLSQERLVFFGSYDVDLVRFNAVTQSMEAEAPFEQLKWMRLQDHFEGNPTVSISTNYTRFNLTETWQQQVVPVDEWGAMRETLNELSRTGSVMDFPSEYTPPYTLSDGLTLECTVNMSPSEINVAQLRLLAFRLEKLPVRLDRFECSLADGRLQGCRIWFVVRGS